MIGGAIVSAAIGGVALGTEELERFEGGDSDPSSLPLPPPFFAVDSAGDGGSVDTSAADDCKGTAVAVVGETTDTM